MTLSHHLNEGLGLHPKNRQLITTFRLQYPEGHHGKFEDKICRN